MLPTADRGRAPDPAAMTASDSRASILPKMDQRQAMAAFGNLARTSPPYVGSRVDVEKNEVVRVCTRCGAEERKSLPRPVSVMRDNPAAVPPGFDDELFAWMRSFAEDHQKCGAADPG